MKQILTILFAILSCASYAQFPVTHGQSNAHTKEKFEGAIYPVKGLINGRYADTATANLDYVAGERGAQIVVGNTIYLRDNTATKWIVAGGYGAIASNITILNDSSISICNGSSCDTFSFTNIVVKNFSVVNDSTILVCDGNKVCDTLFIPPTPISKNFVDSTKIRGGDSLFYYINGNEYLGGVISPKSNISIANDSSLVICSSNRCDTFIFNDIIINSFTVVNDSTILVCDGNNTCDTLHITPTPLAKNYVDSVKVDGSLIYYYINGSANLAGVITDLSAYHTATQLSDTSYSLNRPNNTKTVFILESDTTGSGGTGNGVQSVSGLNTDNTDAINPIVKISVDGTTITGEGTPASPLISHTTGIVGGVDSAAIHIDYITVAGDSAIVFSDLKGNSDTVSMSLLQYWKKSLNTVYVAGNNKVSIGTNKANSKLEVNADGLGDGNADSAGIRLSNTAISTSSISQNPGTLLFESNGWNSPLSIPMKNMLRFRNSANGTNSFSQKIYPTLTIEGSLDSGKNYLTYGTFAYGPSGSNFSVTAITASNINSINVAASASLTGKYGGYNDRAYVSRTMAVGSSPSTNDSSASLRLDNNNLGFLPNRLTAAQRDSINMYVSSVIITNGGIGYTSAPTVTFSLNDLPVNAGSPSHASGTATISSGAVTGITITDAGYYNTPPTITFLGGGGTGAAATAVITQRALPPGLTIYCTDCTATDSSTGVIQTWNGSTWKNNW